MRTTSVRWAWIALACVGLFGCSEDDEPTASAARGIGAGDAGDAGGSDVPPGARGVMGSSDNIAGSAGTGSAGTSAGTGAGGAESDGDGGLGGTGGRGALNEGCFRAGCANELCVEEDFEDFETTCEFRDEFECFQRAECERQADGSCGFTRTPDLEQCLDNAATP